VSVGWRRTGDYLARLEADCAAAKVAHLDPDRPAAAIADLSQEMGLPLIGPLPAIQARHAERSCSFAYDDHRNREGIDVAFFGLLDLPHDRTLRQ